MFTRTTAIHMPEKRVSNLQHVQTVRVNQFKPDMASRVTQNIHISKFFSRRVRLSILLDS